MDFDLWVIFKGSAELRINDGEWSPMERGSCCWLTPQARYEFRVTGIEKLEMGYVHFDCYNASGELVPPANVAVEALRCDATDPHLFEFGIRRLFYLLHRLREANRLQGKRIESQMSHLLHVLLCEYAFFLAEAPQAAANGLEARHLQMTTAATAWIYQHPDLNCSIEELASRFGYNARYFCRIFAQLTGRTPRQIIIQAKIDHAKQLLGKSAMNISEIAESLGYCNIYYFSRQFRKEVGICPTVYRQSTPRISQKVKKGQKKLPLHP